MVARITKIFFLGGGARDEDDGVSQTELWFLPFESTLSISSIDSFAGIAVSMPIAMAAAGEEACLPCAPRTWFLIEA